MGSAGDMTRLPVDSWGYNPSDQRTHCLVDHIALKSYHGIAGNALVKKTTDAVQRDVIQEKCSR
jgi:hypothetical protein